MWRIDKGWVYIADNTIQSNSGRVNSCTDKWSLYVGSRTFSEYSLEHQLTSNNLKNTSRNTLEREIDASVSTIKIMSSGIDDADDVELHTDETVADLSPRIAYNFHHEEFLAGLQYNATRLDYEKLGYGEHKAVLKVTLDKLAQLLGGLQVDVLGAAAVRGVRFSGLVGRTDDQRARRLEGPAGI